MNILDNTWGGAGGAGGAGGEAEQPRGPTGGYGAPGHSGHGMLMESASGNTVNVFGPIEAGGSIITNNFSAPPPRGWGMMRETVEDAVEEEEAPEAPDDDLDDRCVSPRRRGSVKRLAGPSYKAMKQKNKGGMIRGQCKK